MCMGREREGVCEGKGSEVVCGEKGKGSVQGEGVDVLKSIRRMCVEREWGLKRKREEGECGEEGEGVWRVRVREGYGVRESEGEDM